MVQLVNVKAGNPGALRVVGETDEGGETGVIGDGVSVVVEANPVIPHGVGGTDIALVLRASRSDERVPVLYAYLGPVGGDEEQVVGVVHIVARPKREAQVVADNQPHTDTFVLEYRPLVARREEAVLVAVGVEVRLVHEGRLVIGTEEEAPVVERFLLLLGIVEPGGGYLLADERPADSDSCLVGGALEGLHRASVGCLRQFGAVGAEAGGEHLGQEGEVGFPFEASDASDGSAEVGFLVRPDDGVLENGYTEHSYQFSNNKRAKINDITITCKSFFSYR